MPRRRGWLAHDVVGRETPGQGGAALSESSVITGMTRPRPRVDRLRIVLDDATELELAEELVLEAGLAEGLRVSRVLLEELERRDEGYQARDAALRLLSHRARSARELARRLARKGFPETVVAATVAAMQERGYLDDEAYAAAFVRDRLRLRPRGRRRLAAELRARGVAPGTADRAIEETFEEADVSEPELAAQAAAAWAARNAVPGPGEDRDVRLKARRRLYGYLSRRGFDPDAVRRAVSGVFPDN